MTVHLNSEFEWLAFRNKLRVGFPVDHWVVVVDIGKSDLQQGGAGFAFCVSGLQCCSV